MRRTSVCESKRCTADVNGHFCRFAVAFAFAYDRFVTSSCDVDPVDGPVLRSAHSDLDLDFDHNLGPELNLDHDLTLTLTLDPNLTSTMTLTFTLNLTLTLSLTGSGLRPGRGSRLLSGIGYGLVSRPLESRSGLQVRPASNSIDRCKQDASWKKMSGKYFFLVANCNLP